MKFNNNVNAERRRGLSECDFSTGLAPQPRGEPRLMVAVHPRCQAARDRIHSRWQRECTLSGGSRADAPVSRAYAPVSYGSNTVCGRYPYPACH